MENDGTVPLLYYKGESDRTTREHLADNFADKRGGAEEARPEGVAGGVLKRRAALG